MLMAHHRAFPFASILFAMLCLRAPAQDQATDLAILNATVYTSPHAPPQRHTTILLHAGKIAAIGSHLSLPAHTRTLPCAHCVVSAGFWNTHVHFTGLAVGSR